MKWAIIVLIMFSLIGSMMWVMPSPRQRFQSKLRLEARKHGFQVQLSRLELPRAQGETETEAINVPAYRLLRGALPKGEREKWTEWSVGRVDAFANEGLPEGWSWIKGERTLNPAKLAFVSQWLKTLPKEVEAVESTAIHLSLYWREPERAGALDELHGLAKQLIDEVV